MKRIALALFDALWLPLFLVSSVLWLYAPLLNHDHIGRLQVISMYEGTRASFAWLFRAGDITGAIILILAVARARLLRFRPWLGYLLLLVAIGMLIDDTFVIGCYQHCDLWGSISHRVHDIESMVSVLVLFAATAVDALGRGRYVSRLFLGAQLFAGLIAMITSTHSQVFIAMQYFYQVSAIAWIAYILRRYLPAVRLPGQRYVRLGAALLLFVGGLLGLVIAFHVRLHHPLPVWLSQHGVIAGVIMLYLSRQMLKGQRRAAIIVVIVLISQLFVNALVRPRLYSLMLTELTLLVICLYWGAFDRNIGPPPIVVRLKNLGIVFAGTVAALLIVLGAARLTGHQQLLNYELQHTFNRSRLPFRAAEMHEDRLQHELSRVRYASISLGVMLVGLTAWSIFRPAAGFGSELVLERTEAERLLERYAASSEDFFKLWPEDKTYFTQAGIEGFIACKKVGSIMFALADPVSRSDNRLQLLQAFKAVCRNHGWPVCFLGVPEGSSELYRQAELKTIKVGASAVVNVREFSETTQRDKWWRWQLNRATRLGTVYSVSQPPHSPALMEELARLSDTWLERAGHKEQGFALGYFNAAYLQLCRLHLLRDGAGRLVAFANQLPVYNGIRQTTVDLIRFQPDFNGAMPVLIARLLATLRSESEYDTFDLGFVPLAKIDNKIAAIARRLSAGRYSSAGLEQFKDKFRPDWQPQYLAYDGDLIDLTLLMSRLEEALRASKPLT